MSLLFAGRHQFKCRSYRRFNFCSNAIEEWRDIPNFDNYQVSSLGNVWNRKHRRYLQLNEDVFRRNQRRPQLILTNNQLKGQNVYIARLILQAFEPRSDSAHLDANHVDGNYYNNILSNLNWVTRSENVIHNQKLNHRKGTPRSVTLTFKDTETQIQLKSMKKCSEYVMVHYDVRICVRKLTKLCQQKSWCQDIKFEYADSKHYITKVEDYKGEEWAQFHESSSGKQYYVSNFGRIKVVCVKNNTEKLRSCHLINGYWVTNVDKLKNIHKLVASQFVSNPNNYQMIDHIDGCKSNNRASNLQWIKSQRENMCNPNTMKKLKISATTKTINSQAIAQYNLQGDIVQIWRGRKHLKKAFGKNISNILHCCAGRIKTSQGFKWKYDYDREL